MNAGLLVFILLLALSFLGIPIYIALGIGTLVALNMADLPMLVLPQKLFAGMNSSSLLAIPFFILAGNLMSRSITGKLIDVANALIGRIKGSLALVTIVASGLFGAISGSGVAKASSYVVVTSGLPALLLDTFSSLTESRVLILLLLNLLFLIIGMLMEANAAIIMMTPILMPLLTLYGINPLMFGIVMSFNLCIGLVTPPVGLCLLLSNQIGETSLTKSLKALMPMLLISICVLLLITYVDPLTTWLPSLLKK